MEVEIDDLIICSDEEDVFCEECSREFEDGEEYWLVDDFEVEEMKHCLCDDCYKEMLEIRGDIHVEETGGNGS